MKKLNQSGALGGLEIFLLVILIVFTSAVFWRVANPDESEKKDSSYSKEEKKSDESHSEEEHSEDEAHSEDQL